MLDRCAAVIEGIPDLAKRQLWNLLALSPALAGAIAPRCGDQFAARAQAETADQPQSVSEDSATIPSE
jgi:hypothetical protein